MTTRLAALALVALVALAAGCSTVTVTPSGLGTHPAARPDGCTIEFIRTRPPERPYDELASLHWSGTMKDAAAAQEDLRARACALGADAAIVTRDYIPYTQNASGVMTITVIRYRAVPAAPAAQPAAAQPAAAPAAPGGA